MSATATVEITPFQIAIPDADLDDLRQRLLGARWPDELPDVGWDYGIPLQETQDLAASWRDGFNWRDWEARLNAFRSSRPPLTASTSTSCTCALRNRTRCR